MNGHLLFTLATLSVPQPDPRDGHRLDVPRPSRALDLTQFQVFDDADDDPVLLRVDGTPIDTWREGYPYHERMVREDYERAKRLRGTCDAWRGRWLRRGCRHRQVSVPPRAPAMVAGPGEKRRCPPLH